MIVISHDQMRELYSSCVDGFVWECMDKLKQTDPIHTAAAGDEALEAFVRLGIDRARAHEITAKASVTLYLQIMLVLGSHFDEDPMYPWAEYWLKNPDERDTQADTMNRIRQDMLDMIFKVSGMEGEISLRFLARMRAYLGETWVGGAATIETVREQVRELCPERSNVVGPEALDFVIAHAMERVRSANVTRLQPVVAAAIFNLVYGHRVFDDPMHGWAGDALTKAREHHDPDGLLLRFARSYFARVDATMTERLRG